MYSKMVEKRCPVCNKLHFKISVVEDGTHAEIEVKCPRCKRLIKHPIIK